MKIIWSPLAVDRISEIAEYITLDKPSTAEKWVNNIFNSVKRLEQFPKSGRIIYRIEENQISVLTVRNGMQILPIEEIMA